NATVAVASEVPAEAVAAVNGAPVVYKDERPVVVPVNKPWGLHENSVADWIRVLVRQANSLLQPGDKLCADGIQVRILAQRERAVVCRCCKGNADGRVY